MSIQRPSCFFNLYSSCSSRSNKRRRDYLLPPPRSWLCCRAGLTGPQYSHRWPSYPSTHPQAHTCCYSPATADEPVNPRTVVLPSAWEITAASSLPPSRSLPRPHRRPPPWCSRRASSPRPSPVSVYSAAPALVLPAFLSAKYLGQFRFQ